jgi:NAD(P)-dependent dehydrogenase (short-subunit alcohol dehydrogenase family)
VSARIAIVTGASSGIGESTARKLAKDGFSVMLAARSGDKMEAIVGEIVKAGGKAASLATDVTKEADVVRLFAQTVKIFGRVDLLVNNAGIVDNTPTEDTTLERWQHVLDVNLTSAFLCAREAVKIMKAQNGGRILMIGSISARTPRNGGIVYTATKFALDGMTKTIALDGRDYGVTAGIIHPGSTITNFAPNMHKQPQDKAMRPELVADIVACIAGMPPEINVLDTLMLPIHQPFLGRG